MNLTEIAASLKAGAASNPLLTMGAVLTVVGFLFKVALVPFHMWMPDVYEGAPTLVTSFMTTGLKAAAFATFMRVFMSLVGVNDLTSSLSLGFHHLFWVIAVATMFIGNVIALTQRNIKRMLAYSSIAHSGYILVGFIVGGRSEYGFSSVVAYLIGYVIMNIGAFAVVALLGSRGDKNTELSDFSGLGFKRPVLGAAMAIFMFSMAGVPPTVGFAGKYLIFSSAIQAGEVWLAVLSVMCSAISAYYYLRVIVFMYMKEPLHEFTFQRFAVGSFVVVATAVATLSLGLMPTILFNAAKRAISL